MKKLLKKISWLTRKWNISINILSLYLHDSNNSWGFRLMEVRYNYSSYTLLGVDFRLPNGAEVKYAVVDNFDILFLNNILNRWADKYDENKMWSGNGKIKLKVGDRVTINTDKVKKVYTITYYKPNDKTCAIQNNDIKSIIKIKTLTLVEERYNDNDSSSYGDEDDDYEDDGDDNSTSKSSTDEYNDDDYDY